MIKRKQNILVGLAITIILASCVNLGQIEVKDSVSDSDKVKPGVSPSASSVSINNSPAPQFSPVLSPAVTAPTSPVPGQSSTPSTKPLVTAPGSPGPRPIYKTKPGQISTPTPRKYLTPSPRRSPGSVTPVPSRSATPVLFARVKPIFASRCLSCHSASVASGGVILETEEQIKVKAIIIRERVVFEQTMPEGNATKMTQQERDLIGSWVDGGAQ